MSGPCPVKSAQNRSARIPIRFNALFQLIKDPLERLMAGLWTVSKSQYSDGNWFSFMCIEAGKGENKAPHPPPGNRGETV